MRDPPGRPDDAEQAEEARTRRALLHMLEDLKRERDAITKARRRWLDTVDAFDSPLVVVDAALRIVRANRAYARRAGKTFQEVIGRPFGECFPRLAAAQQPVPEEFLLESGETFHTRTFPIGEVDGTGPAWLHLFEDVTERRRAEGHSRAMLEVSGSRLLGEGDPEGLAREITEAAARATGVARANVWLFNEAEDELHCIDLYESASGAHSSGMVLHEHQFENEFRALKRAAYVDASDPYSDPRTSGYVESYLKPLGITSMLDTVVEVSGKHIGLLCLEHVGKAHQWRPEEIAFAARLADKVAVALSNKSRRDAHEALARSERYFRKLIEGSSDAFFVIDATGKMRYRSESGKRLTGFETQEVIGKDLTTIVRPDSLVEARRGLRQVLESPDTLSRAELRIERKDGSTLEVEAIGKNLLADPDVAGIVVTAHDITERNARDRELKASEARYRAMFDQAAVAMIQTSLGGVLMTVNPAFCKILGYSKSELEGHAFAEFTHPDDCAISAAQISALAGGSATSQAAFEKRYLCKDGRVVWTSICVAPVCNEAGKPEYFVTLVEDITERKRVEQALTESEEKFRAVFNNTSDGTLVMDVGTRSVSFANCSMERLLGYGPGALAGVPIAQLIDPEVLAHVNGQFDSGARGELRFSQDMRLRRQDGTVVYVDVTGAPVELGGRQYLLGSVRDAGPRRAGEEKLRAQIDELQRWQGLNLDREDRVIELKREVNELTRQLNLPPRYADGE